MKSYSQQVGPNLAAWCVKCRPDEMVSHGENCGGLLVQDLGKDVYRASQLSESSPGKIFCYECGHKAGKSVTRALKGEKDTNEFYFPKKEEYEIRTLTFVEHGRTLRYWEWRPKMSDSLKKHVETMAMLAKRRGPPGRTYKKIPFQQVAAPRPAKKTQVFQAGDDWMIDHPKVVIRLPIAEFSRDSAEIAAQSISGFRCRNYTREELVAEAMKVLPGGNAIEVPKKNPFQNTDTIMGKHAFILCNAHGLVLFDKNHWDVTSFKMIRNDMRSVYFADSHDLRGWINTRSGEMGISEAAFALGRVDALDAARNFRFANKKKDINF